jgi:hypothetical protein
MFGKKVHVHGELAKKKEVHPPQVCGCWQG